MNTIPKEQATKKSEFDRGTSPQHAHPHPPKKKAPKKQKKPQPLNTSRSEKLSEHAEYIQRNLLSAIFVKPRYDHPLNRPLINLRPSSSFSSPLPDREIKKNVRGTDASSQFQKAEHSALPSDKLANARGKL